MRYSPKPAMVRSQHENANRRRRTLAVAAAFLWFGGFELLPNLHVALHSHIAPHSHGHDHVTPGADAHAHVHYEVTHSHDHGVTDAPLRRHEWKALHPERPHDHPAHGAHSLAHRGLAVAQPPPPPLLRSPIAVRPLRQPRVVAQQPRSRRPQSVRVRGPPFPSSPSA
jgi:hypothetical protein